MQARIKRLYNKSSLLCFCKFLYLIDLRICVCLNKAMPWLELNIKFKQYSIRSFQKPLVGFNNLWIRLVFKEFNWVSMSKIPYPPFQMESWTRSLGGLICCSSRRNCICFFQFPFWFILEQWIFDLWTIVLVKGFSVYLTYIWQIYSNWYYHFRCGEGCPNYPK